MNFLQVIELKYPFNFLPTYKKMQMFSDINLNFTATTPLTYLKRHFKPDSTIFANIGFKSSSFLYNVQGIIVSITVILLAFKLLSAIIPKLQLSNKRLLQRIGGWCQAFYGNRRSVITEFYYQQRMFVYMCLFHFIKLNSLQNTLFRSNSDYLFQLFDYLDYIVAGAIIIGDCYVFQDWVKHVSDMSDHDYLSIQSLLKKESNPFPTYLFKFQNIMNHILIPFILVFGESYSLLQIIILSALFVYEMVLCIITKFDNLKLKASYTISNSILCLFCLTWKISNMFGIVEKNIISGYLMIVLMCIPITTTGILYFPSYVSEIKNLIKKLYLMILKKKKVVPSKKHNKK